MVKTTKKEFIMKSSFRLGDKTRMKILLQIENDLALVSVNMIIYPTCTKLSIESCYEAEMIDNKKPY